MSRKEVSIIGQCEGCPDDDTEITKFKGRWLCRECLCPTLHDRDMLLDWFTCLQSALARCEEHAPGEYNAAVMNRTLRRTMKKIGMKHVYPWNGFDRPPVKRSQ